MRSSLLKDISTTTTASAIASKLMFIVMHDRDQKHVVMVDEINRFTTLLSSWLTTSRTAARTIEEILMGQNTISKKNKLRIIII